MRSRLVLAWVLILLVALPPTAGLSDPVPVNPFPSPPPKVFCFRITDVEADPNIPNRFTFEFEVLNWTNQPAYGLYGWLSTGTKAESGLPPTLVLATIDEDGRGGPPGGLHIGTGIYNSPAHQSGRGRGDIPNHRNDWEVTFVGETSMWWSAPQGGTPIPPRNMFGAPNSAGQWILVPGVGNDGLLQPDTAIDGGPKFYSGGNAPFPTGGQPNPDGSGNVLDGFVMTIDDFNEGEVLSINWMLTDQSGEGIGKIGTGGNLVGDPMGFGVFNVRRIPVGGSLGPGLFAGNSGFRQVPDFFGNTFKVPDPTNAENPPIAEFGAEFGALIIAPPLNPDVADEVPAELPATPPSVDPEVTPPNAELLPCPMGLPGDTNGDKLVDVTDVQCVILLSLWDLQGKSYAVPGCLTQSLDKANIDCNTQIDVVDVLLVIRLSFQSPFDLAIDSNRNFCHDACDCTAEKCDDGNPCTVDGCGNFAQCVHEPFDCGDGDPCTTDVCDPLVGCVSSPVGCSGAQECPDVEGMPCDDGNPCNNNDICTAGVCFGDEPDCDDGNPCTQDICAQTGCVSTNLSNGTSCGDGDQVCIAGACILPASSCNSDADCNTGTDLCQMYACQAVPGLGFAKTCVPSAKVTCNDQNACTDDSCDPAVGCVYANDDTNPCSDGNLCTISDHCEGGVCVTEPNPCDDGNPCSISYCDGSTSCYAEPILSGECDDNNACTENTTCQLGHCLGTAVACDDSNLCTADSCDPAVGCLFKPIVCDDKNPCTDDSCDPAVGCVFAPNSSPCNDNNACTSGDLCTMGSCGGGETVQCDDNSACTADTCNPSIGCVFAAISCNDNNPCTDDGCIPATGCTHSFNSGPCQDGNACTSNDICQQGLCVSGPPTQCNDNNLCTDDSCNEVTGCVFAANTLPCDDNNQCTTDDQCKNKVCTGGPLVDCGDGNPCTDDLCVNGEGCIHTANQAPCNDGDICTIEDFCSNGVCVPGSYIDCQNGCPKECLKGLPLPYVETFDDAGTFESVDWALSTDLGSESNNWMLTTHGPLGADLHPRFHYAPHVYAFSERLTTPLLDTTGHDAISLTFDLLFLPGAPMGVTTLKAQISPDGGDTWTTVWQHSTDLGMIGPTPITVDISSVTQNSPIVQVSFLLEGDDSFDIFVVDLDTVKVLPGGPPAITPISKQIVEETTAQSLQLVATDADSPLTQLNFTLISPPPFVNLTDNGNGTATLVIAPPSGSTDAYTVTVSVSDGLFVDTISFPVIVIPKGTGGGGPDDPPVTDIAAVMIRSGFNNTGTVVNNLDLVVGNTVLLVAAGYDENLQYVNDVGVLWTTTGNLDPVPEGPSTSVTFTGSSPETAGTVVATFPLAGVVSDETGIITVSAKGQTPPAAKVSTLTSTKSALVADGNDTTTLTVTVKDQNGNLVTAPATVEINSTAGTLLGSVQPGENGTYTQVLKASADPQIATISATVNGAPVGNVLAIPIANVQDLVASGVTKIDCANYSSFAGKDLRIKGGTVAFDTADCAPMEFGNIFVENSGKITHSATTAAKVQKMDLRVQSLTVDSSSTIDVSGLGYLAKTGWSNLAQFGTCTNCGGSHGGRGGNASGSSAVAVSYGQYRNPQFPGGGGGGGIGGGLVRIEVTHPNGAITVHGKILANGTTHNNGGGAGGSVYLSSPVVQGNGSIEANGGGGQTCCGYNSGGGAGGRIAIVSAKTLLGAFAFDNHGVNLKAFGGAGWNNGGAGTVFVKRTTDLWGTLVVDNNNLVSNSGSTPLVDVGTGKLDLLTDTTLTDVDFTTRPVNFYVGYTVNPNVSQGSSNTLTDDQIFAVISNTNDTLTVPEGLSAVTAPGQTYRAIDVLDNLEIRGKAALKTSGDLLVYSGDWSSKNQESFVLGGELLCTTLELVNVNNIKAVNGVLQVTEIMGHGQKNYPFVYALSQSTLAATSWNVAFATAVSSTINAGTINALSDLTFDNSTVTLSLDQITVAGVFELINNTLLKHAASTADSPRRLSIVAHGVMIDSTSKIDVTGLGYPAGVSLGTTGSLAAKGKSGGTHGGSGSAGSDAKAVGLPVGNLWAPFDPGAGGGTGGPGGGVVRITATHGVTVNGIIQTDGAANNNGGGAGGSVWIVAETLGGTGSIRARGGAGQSCCGYNSGSGGGGRIAIYADALLGGFAAPTTVSSLVANGGSGWSNGGAGTIFVQTAGQQFGDLIVHNQGVTSAANSTPLISVGDGIIDDITPNSLTDLTANFGDLNYLANMPLNPNISQGSDNSLADDMVFFVKSNGATSLGFGPDSDLTSVASSGSTYRSLHVFDNLQISGGGKLFTLGDLLVIDGDITSLNDTSMVISGSVSAQRIDLANCTQLVVEQGGLVADVVLAGNTIAAPLLYTFNQSTVGLGSLHADSVLVNGGTITVGTATADADITLDGGSIFEVTGDNMWVAGSLLLTGNSTLRHAATTASQVYRLVVQAGNVVIAAGSAVDVSARGYTATRSFQNTTTLGSQGNSGGSHGGLGAAGSQAKVVGTTYDSLWSPDEPGGGGGNSQGGGVVRLVVSGNLTVNGAIRANGAYGTVGGAAGGSIYIEAHTLDGTGIMEVKGGAGETCCGYGAAGGGGGRLAVYYQSLQGGFGPATLLSRLDARGGTGWANAAAGTVYLKGPGQTWGDLIVDNEGVEAAAMTLLVGPGPGTSDSLTSTSLTDLDANFVSGLYKGIRLNPNVMQGNPHSLVDDQSFVITDNTQTVLNLDGDAENWGPAGSTYRSLYIFDNLEVTNKGKLKSLGDILVFEGDWSSQNATTFQMSGTIEAQAMDIEQVKVVSVTGGINVGKLQGAGQQSAPVDYGFVSSTVTLPVLSAQSVQTTGTTLYVGTLSVANDMTVNGGIVEIQDTTMTVGGKLVLTGSSVLRTTATTASKWYPLELTAANVVIDNGSGIDLTGRGYLSKIGFGGTSALASAGNSGGSHGGFGAKGSQGASNGVTYGNLFAPVLPGGGGGNTVGGGVVRLIISDTLTVNGYVRANGSYGTQGGSAGGSIYIDATKLTGNGTVEAKGGAGETCCGYGASGGGGGRIALVVGALEAGFAAGTLRQKVDTSGGSGWSNGAAGTIYVMQPDNVYGDLIVDNKGINAPNATTLLVGPPEGQNESISGSTLTDLQANFAAGLYAGIPLNPNIAQGSPNDLADDMVFGVTNNSATVLSLDNDPSVFAQAGDTYRTLYSFDSLEIDGKARLETFGDLLVTGGDFDSQDTTTFSLNGTIIAKVVDLQNADVLSITGTVTANKVQGKGLASPPVAYSLVDATVDVPFLHAATLQTSGTALTVDSLVVDGNMTVSGGSVEVRDSAVTVGGTLALTGNSVLRHPVTTTQKTYTLDVAANNLTIDSGSAIDVSGRGYPATIGFGGTTALGSSGNSGGSHGGLGSKGSQAKASGLAYGSYTEPSLPGAGSGNAAGGGVVRLMVVDTLTLGGAIRANGAYGTAGGAAGGSVFVTTGTVTGTGTIEAKGGAGETCCGYGAAGGGGGRVAVHYDALAGGFGASTVRQRLDARGGTGWANGGAGTVYLRGPGQTYGDLIIDNKGVSSFANSTPLVSVGSGTILALSDAALTDLSATWTVDLYVDTWLNPNADQGNPHSLADDVLFQITSNSATVLNLADDATTVAAAGDAYRGTTVLDSLEITGDGRLFTGGDLLVLEGDYESGNLTTFKMTGALVANTFDIHDVSVMNVTGLMTVGKLQGNGASTPPIAYSFKQAAITMPQLVAQTLIVDGGTLTLGTLECDGDVTTLGEAVIEIQEEDVLVSGLLQLGGTSVMRHPPTTAAKVNRLSITATAMTVGAQASVDTSARGYAAQTSFGNTNVLGSKGNSGGSHGGMGAKGSQGNVNGLVYGHYAYPTYPGAGGGNSAGGGVVHIDVATTLTVDGAVRANGAYGTAGGGAGGSIFVNTSVLAGNGKIEAKGGNGESCCGYGAAGGGGGRVAIQYEALSGGFGTAIFDRVDAQGAPGWALGGAGTIWMLGPDQVWGDLIFDNENVDAAAGLAKLVSLGTGTVDGLTTASLYDAGMAWVLGIYSGMMVNPNVSQGFLSTLTDDTLFSVVDNTAFELFLDGDPNGVASVGSTYRSVDVVDRLEIRGKAKVQTTGDLVVLSGDMHSAPGNFDVPTGASLTGALLEFVDIPAANITGSITAQIKKLCADCP